MDHTPCTVRQLETASDVLPAGSRRPSLVIADRGDRAWLLVTEGCPAIGARFSHAGLLWHIVRRRDQARALIAEPVQGSCAIS